LPYLPKVFFSPSSSYIREKHTNREEREERQGNNPKIILQTGSLYFGSIFHGIPE